MSDQDPMLSQDPAEREAYKSMIAKFIKSAVEETRAARRQPSPDPSQPVIQGANGFGGSIAAI